LRYAENQCEGPNPFDKAISLENAVVQVCWSGGRGVLWVCWPLQAIGWIAKNTPEQIQAHREAMISSLEDAGAAMQASGLRDQWFSSADRECRAVAGGANGHLLHVLLDAIGYCDVACADLLREGAGVGVFIVVVHSLRLVRRPNGW